MKIIGGYLSLDFSCMWLPWKGVATQIRIESEPCLKYMITEYNCPNKVAYFETEIGVYKRGNCDFFNVQS